MSAAGDQADIHALLEFSRAAHRAQRETLPIPPEYRAVLSIDEVALVLAWREAIVRQLLTPAPRAADLIWKRAALKAGQWEYTATPRNQIEQAIVADVAWLGAHRRRTRVRA